MPGKSATRKGAAAAKSVLVPDPHYRSLFQSLFSEQAAQYAYTILAKENPLDGAYSTDAETNLWRTWREARQEFAQGRLLHAFNLLNASRERFELDANCDWIAELERLNLYSECLASGNQLVSAAQTSRQARQVLRRFLEKAGGNHASAGAELRKMVEILTATNVEAGDDGGILGGWLLSRGVDLACTLAQRMAALPRSSGEDDDFAARGLEDDIALIETVLGSTLELDARIKVQFALGDIYTDNYPDRAFRCFDGVANTLGMESGLGLQAAGNAAGCLMRMGQFEESEARYASMESIFEMMGNYSNAARVWMSECVANWKRLRDPAILHSLIGAIAMYEESLPTGADVMTRYVQKQYMEPGYLLLIAVIAHSEQRSDCALNDLLSATWAIMSRDQLANLEPKPKQDPWDQVLQQARQPLATMKSALAPYPGLGVVHLVSATDSMIWMAYGYDTDGHFQFEYAALGSEHGERLVKFIQAMHEELEADRLDDALACADIERELQELGDRLAAELPKPFWEILLKMKRLVYMPHPYGSVDEFPLGGLRVDGELLAERLPIVRSPSFMHLRENLSPNRGDLLPQGDAVVVLGATEAMGQKLETTLAESERVKATLEKLGFRASVNSAPTCKIMEELLDGAAGALHYIGHGIADNIHEGLPLADGEVFGPNNADRLKGFRVPFVFVCACMAARVRSGSGGYQTGIASKLCERGAPGVVSFLMPVTEKTAYALRQAFYRAATQLSLGEASRDTVRSTKEIVPLYARLAFTAYGDPSFRLTTMPQGPTAMLKHESQSWHAAFRTHCVLRTRESSALVATLLNQAPESFAPLLRRWLAEAFQDPASIDEDLLVELEKAALQAENCALDERLSVHAAVMAELLHRSGIEKIPIYIDTTAESVRRLLSAARFLAELGATIFDARLNGLGNSLLGRVITVDQNNASPAAMFLRQGREKLLECEHQSPFVTSLREWDRRILEEYGLPA